MHILCVLLQVPEAWDAYLDADIDMFIYGLDEQAAKAKIEVTVKSITVKLKQSNLKLLTALVPPVTST
jgi:hypothetical protein